MILFIKLLLAHLLGDFILQPGAWVREKELKTYRSAKLYLHGLIHLLLILLLTWDLRMVPLAFVIAATHIGIDAWKLQYQKPKNKRLFFFLDQLLHVIIIVIAVQVVERPQWNIYPFSLDMFLILATGLVILLTPSSIVIKLILSKWAPATEIKSDKIETSSLLHAGMVIGFLERILVFIFILSNQWAAIGFLITAKSVFRFSDLKIGQDRKLTEYILIGTLLSFGIAIVTGILTAWVIATDSIV